MTVSVIASAPSTSIIGTSSPVESEASANLSASKSFFKSFQSCHSSGLSPPAFSSKGVSSTSGASLISSISLATAVFETPKDFRRSAST